MKLANTAGCSQGKKEEDVTNEIPERTRGERFERRTPKRRENLEKIPRRKPRGRKRTFETKGAQKVMKYRMRRQLWKNKAESSTKHRVIGRDRRVGKLKRATKMK